MNCVRKNLSEHFLDVLICFIYRFSMCTVEYTKHDVKYKKTCSNINSYKLKY